MTAQPDILVLGLGPAGSMAAHAAALAGYRVLAIEKKDVPGKPVQCAEFVPAMIGTQIAALAQTKIQSITSMRTAVEQSPADIMENFPGQMIDRQAFDAQLAGEAAKAGAITKYGTIAKTITPGGIVTLSNGTEIHPKIIIGGDGPHSILGHAIGAPISDILTTRQINVPLLKPFDSTDIYLSHKMPGGYGWAFPKGDTVNIGLGVVPRAKADMKPLLDELHQHLIDQGRVGKTINAHTGGAIPAGGMGKIHGQLGGVLCLLAGDAAGLTNPITGAGINSAVISGQLAGDAAADYLDGDARAAAQYQQDITDLFGPSLARALAHKEKLAHIQPRPNPDQLRSSWIAYPQYWQSPPITNEEIPCPA